MAEEQEPDGPFKVIVIGDPFVGKTSLVNRYSQGLFEENYKRTLGVDFALKLVERPNQPSVYLQLWDIAGQDTPSTLTRVYFRHAAACILVFDLSNRNSFDGIHKWMQEVQNKVYDSESGPIPTILLGNKCDLRSQEVSDEDIEQMKSQYNLLGCFKTSAKNNTNIEKAIESLLDHIKYIPEDEKDSLPKEKPSSNCSACS
eukprot:gene295-3665_t